MVNIDLPYGGWTPRDYQLPLWKYLDQGGKRAIGIWHRRAGKDEVLLHRTCIAAMERPATYWHSLPEYAQARKALWAAVNPHTGKRRIDEAFPEELRESTNEQEMFIRFKNGSTWQLVGSDRYNALVGAGVAGVTFSEWALCNPSAWGYIRPMLEENNGWAAFITTPRGRNHAFDMYKLASNSKDWFAELLSINDTAALPPEKLEEAIHEYEAIYGADVGRAQYEQEYLCSFNASILGAFYAQEMRRAREEGRIAPVVPVPGRPVNRAWDIGVRDDTSIVWFQTYQGRIYIIDAYTSSGAGVEHYADVVHGKGYGQGVDYVPHDAKAREWGTGKTRLEAMIEHGLKPQLIPMATKLDGINAARRAINITTFDPRCEETLVAALEQYRRKWDDERKTFQATEERDWTTHLSDAFRYLAMAWQHAPAEPPPPPEAQQAGQVILEGPPEPRSTTRIQL